jgi:hypothetical protein
MRGNNEIVQGFCQNPVSFCGGFLAGLLRLNLSDDPLKSWLEQQGIATNSDATGADPGSPKGPQNISID